VADVELAELAAGRQVAAAYARHQAAAEALAALSGLVVDTQEESLELLRRAVEEGEMSTTDVLILRRELVEGEREQIETAGELWRARIELELAVGGSAGDATGGETGREENDHVE
jgi:cobalt-zinc-cadmium efflux system outer membrane protein